MHVPDTLVVEQIGIRDHVERPLAELSDDHPPRLVRDERMNAYAADRLERTRRREADLRRQITGGDQGPASAWVPIDFELFGWCQHAFGIVGILQSDIAHPAAVCGIALG